MTGALRIISAGARTLVQDRGFRNARSMGVPAGGVLDVIALRLVNALLGNPAGTEALEFALEGRQIHALLSTRFDRDIQIVEGAGLVTRVHVEDFCQALGLPPTLKYERNSVNPAHRFSAAALKRIGIQTSVPTLFQRDILQHTLFNLLVGNSDNHGKNGSVIHQHGGTSLAPLYDVVPVFMDRSVTHQLAFRHGAAEFAEDFTQGNLRGLLTDPEGRPMVPTYTKKGTRRYAYYETRKDLARPADPPADAAAAPDGPCHAGHRPGRGRPDQAPDHPVQRRVRPSGDSVQPIRRAYPQLDPRSVLSHQPGQ